MLIYQLAFCVLPLTIEATPKDINVHIDLKDLENIKTSDVTNLVFHTEEEGGAKAAKGASATEGVETGADYAEDDEDDEDDSCFDEWTNCATHATDNVCWKSRIKTACPKSCGLCEGKWN